jgi:hypothetical protein
MTVFITKKCQSHFLKKRCQSRFLPLRETGPPACEDKCFIRQFEDYEQFNAWTDDLMTLGYDLINPRTAARNR